MNPMTRRVRKADPPLRSADYIEMQENESGDSKAGGPHFSRTVREVEHSWRRTIVQKLEAYPLDFGHASHVYLLAVKKLLIRAVLLLVVAYIGFASFIWWAMSSAPETFGRVMMRMPDVAYMLVPFETMWMRARAGHLHAGDAAPDFNLAKLDKSDHVQLSSLTAQKPVVLVFGSYT